MIFSRIDLKPNEEQKITHDSQKVTIYNLGPADVYINFDGAATIDSLVIPAKVGRTFPMGYKVRAVHAIAVEATTIQIDGMG